MRKAIIIATIALASSMFANAQLLWKISGNGLEKPSYIVGTHHIAPSGMIDSIPMLKEALESIDIVMGEIDMETVGQMDMMTMAKYMSAPADSTLDKLLTPAQLDSLSNTFIRYTGQAVPLAMINNLKPATIATQLTVLQAMSVIPGFNPQDQFDTVIQAIAKNSGKKISGFETVEQQMQLLYGLPVREQADALMEAVRNDSLFLENAKAMAAAYMRGDLDTLLAMMNDPVTGMDEANAERMIYSRNNKWVSFLLGALPTSTMLIAVGAGHLPGEKGLISLLRKAGFKVEAL